MLRNHIYSVCVCVCVCVCACVSVCVCVSACISVFDSEPCVFANLHVFVSRVSLHVCLRVLHACRVVYVFVCMCV